MRAFTDHVSTSCGSSETIVPTEANKEPHETEKSKDANAMTIVEDETDQSIHAEQDGANLQPMQVHKAEPVTMQPQESLEAS
ncbi:hypothetical protein HAX54_041505 [Datura stramonium]|uniref:Uncharacterized protein n=1 Tax=Datura stramonium TaxID=4076 RepID=A0ABS8VQN6_DATST|nr:hypothetical protein [Datura stramonium]